MDWRSIDESPAGEPEEVAGNYFESFWRSPWTSVVRKGDLRGSVRAAVMEDLSNLFGTLENLASDYREHDVVEAIPSAIEVLEDAYFDLNGCTKPAIPLGNPISADEIVNTDPAIPWAIWPIAVRGAITLLHASPKAGKSLFVVAVALAAAMGDWLGGLLEIPRPMTVIYWSLEDGPRRWSKRLREAIKQHVSPGFPKHLYVYTPSKTLRLPGDADRMIEVIQRLGAELVVIDPLVYALAGDENSVDAVRESMAALRRVAEVTDAAVMVIHHRRKGGSSAEGADVIDQARGSSAIVAAADIVIALRRSGQADGKLGLVLDLVAKDGPDTSLRATYDPAHPEHLWEIQEAKGSAKDDPGLLKLIETVRECGARTTEHWVRTGEVARAANREKEAVRRDLEELFSAGLIEAQKAKGKESWYRPRPQGSTSSPPPPL